MPARPVYDGIWPIIGLTVLATLVLSAITLPLPRANAQFGVPKPAPPGPADQIGGCCGTCVGFSMFGALACVVVSIMIAVTNVAAMIWVTKDAKARGMEGATWAIFTLLAGVLAYVVYLYSRPQGELVACEHCDNDRLEVSAKCPHCGNP